MAKIKVVGKRFKAYLYGDTSFDTLYKLRDMLDDNKRRYKVYIRHGLFWKRSYTINDLMYAIPMRAKCRHKN